GVASRLIKVPVDSNQGKLFHGRAGQGVTKPALQQFDVVVQKAVGREVALDLFKPDCQIMVRSLNDWATLHLCFQRKLVGVRLCKTFKGIRRPNCTICHSVNLKDSSHEYRSTAAPNASFDQIADYIIS